MSILSQHPFSGRSMKRSASILSLVLIISLLTAACAPAPQTTGVATAAQPQAGQSVLINPDDAQKLLKENSSAVLLDVRTPDEFAEGHIEGAVNLAVEELESRLNELPSDKATPIVVYCRSGRRSALAAEILVKAGYSAIYDLGGIQNWPYEIVK